MAGITVATGYAGGPPLKTGTIAVGAVMAALLYRARTGVGQFIDFSQLESLICLVGETVLDYSVNGWVAGRNGNGHSVYAPHGVYPCQGHDKWISIAVTNDAEWVALCGVMQRSDLAKDPRFEGVAVRHRNQDSLDPIPGEWTSRQERYQAMGLLQAAGVPARSVLDQDEALTGPQAEHRGFLANLTHPDNVQHPYINSPAQFSRTPAGVRTPGPLLGQHNSYILGELLGLSAEQLDSLEVSGVTATLVNRPFGGVARGCSVMRAPIPKGIREVNVTPVSGRPIAQEYLNGWIAGRCSGYRPHPLPGWSVLHQAAGHLGRRHGQD